MNNLSIRKVNQLKNKKKKGFTLIELIIVIAIIAILAVIALPKFAEIRENANVKADIASAKAIQSAVSVAVTNGTTGFELGSDSTHPNVIDATELKAVVNGGVVPAPKAKAIKAASGTFSAEIDSDGNVKVKAGTVEVLPDPDAPYNS